MGLIETAIVTGGGIYAVNKLAKAAETRHSHSQYRKEPRYQQPNRTTTEYQTPAQPRGLEGSGNEGNAPPGYWYSVEHDAYYPVPRAPQFNKGNYAMFSSEREYQEDGLLNEHFGAPPPYSFQQQTGYALPSSRDSSQAHGASPLYSRGDLAGQAMDFIMRAADAKKRNS